MEDFSQETSYFGYSQDFYEHHGVGGATFGAVSRKEASLMENFTQIDYSVDGDPFLPGNDPLKTPPPDTNFSGMNMFSECGQSISSFLMPDSGEDMARQLFNSDMFAEFSNSAMSGDFEFVTPVSTPAPTPVPTPMPAPAPTSAPAFSRTPAKFLPPMPMPMPALAPPTNTGSRFGTVAIPEPKNVPARKGRPCKTVEQKEKRERNNEAVRKCRANQKVKHDELKEKLKQLETENAEMMKKMKKLQDNLELEKRKRFYIWNTLTAMAANGQIQQVVLDSMPEQYQFHASA